MSIYRGAGGSGDAVNDASSEAILTVQAKDAAIAAQVAAEASATSASNSATSAASSASGASTSASAASSSASAASTSASNASSSASAASTSATNAAASASTATTQATNASSSASAASTSATNASNSATAASTSASNASTSATNASNSATAAASSATSAAASFDSFDDRYLGAKSSAPTVDNDGNTLLTGALYFNTVDNAMKVWSGSAWLDAYASLSGAVTSVSGTAPIVSSGGTAPAISITQATTSANGFLSSTDWNTFNGKQAALVSGTNIKTVASQSLVGAGDVTFSSISPITTTGDIIIGTATNTSSRLGAGDSGYLLTSNGAGTAPSWQAAPVSLPSQTGNANKFLKTDGTAASWSTLPTVLPILIRAGSTVSVSVGNGVLPVTNRAGSTVNVAVN